MTIKIPTDKPPANKKKVPMYKNAVLFFTLINLLLCFSGAVFSIFNTILIHKIDTIQNL